MVKSNKYFSKNRLNKIEKLIQKSANIFLIISILDFLLIFIKPIRNYHFTDFPNNHLIGVTLLFVVSSFRIFQAKNQGIDPYMEASREWRNRKDMLNEYDFFGPNPDYSNKIYNLIYFIGVSMGTGLVIFNLIF
jgi:hypothetical protein